MNKGFLSCKFPEMLEIQCSPNLIPPPRRVVVGGGNAIKISVYHVISIICTLGPGNPRIR